MLSAMAVRPIRIFGDPILRSTATAVVDFDRSLDRLVADLCETLVDAAGAGLAAPQTGVGLRASAFAVTDKDDPDHHDPRPIVNHLLVRPDTEQLGDYAGAPSMPGLPQQRPP